MIHGLALNIHVSTCTRLILGFHGDVLAQGFDDHVEPQILTHFCLFCKETDDQPDYNQKIVYQPDYNQRGLYQPFYS